MRQVKRVPEDRELFEQLLLTRAVAVIAGQPERMQLPSRERVLSLLTDDEIKTAIENAAYCAGEFVRRVKENGDSPMLADASGYGQAADTIQVAVNEWRGSAEFFLDLLAAIGAVGPHVRSRVARIENIARRRRDYRRRTD